MIFCNFLGGVGAEPSWWTECRNCLQCAIFSLSPIDTFVHFLNLKTQRVLILLFVLGLPCNSVLFCAFVFFVFCCYFINFHQKWSKIGKSWIKVKLNPIDQTEMLFNLLWIYRRLIGRPYIALARQAQIYRNILNPFDRLATLHFNAKKRKRFKRHQQFTHELISSIIIHFYFLLHSFNSYL